MQTSDTGFKSVLRHLEYKVTDRTFKTTTTKKRVPSGNTPGEAHLANVRHWHQAFKNLHIKPYPKHCSVQKINGLHKGSQAH